MTDEEILEIASNYLHYDVDGNKAYEWRGEPHELFKFARELWAEGFKVGYDEGWEGSKVSTKMNTWSSDDD